MPPAAVVTGGTSGIGRAVVEELARRGWRVSVVSRREDGLPEHPTVSHVSANLADAADLHAAAEEVARRHDRLDLLVHAAGYIAEADALAGTTAADMVASYTIHAVAPLVITRSLAAALRRSAGSVVIVGSIYGDEVVDQDVIAYGAAKSAAAYVSEALSVFLAPEARVNLVAPGHVDTPMTAGAPPEFIEGVVSTTPLRRLATADEIAEVIMFLASPAASFVTGATIRVDGGYSAGLGVLGAVSDDRP